MTEQFEKDAAFYWSVCILRRLRDMGLLTATEYEKIRDISAKHYGTKLLCV
jgi:hypothetical protein